MVIRLWGKKLNIYINFRVLNLLLVHLIVFQIYGYESEGPDQKSEAPRVFIDCDDCDFPFILKTIDFVNYVRDPESAQVQVIVTNQKTASNGTEYYFMFLGRQEFQGKDHRLSFVSHQSSTKDEVRRGLTEVLKVGFLNYLIEMSAVSSLEISVQNKKEESFFQPAVDRWNFWVFSVDAGGRLESEATQKDLSLEGALSVSRVTDLWKFESDVEFDTELEEFEDDGETITSNRFEIEGDAGLIRSLNDHWSLGFLVDYKHSTYRNISGSFRLAPGIEYNFFSWKELERRSLTLSYKAGIHDFIYMEETLYNKTKECLLFEAFELNLYLVKSWGDVETKLEYAHFFHDASKYKIESESTLAFRLFKGLSFTMDMKIESIHDQLYLPKGDATIEEILLKQKQLATDYNLTCSIGLRYTFGSIYNNVINRRLR